MTRFQPLRSTFHRACRRGSTPGRYAVVAALVLSFGATSVALAGGERKTLFGDTRNGTYAKETKIISSSATYGTRQSNVKVGDGGGAIYGCRSASGREPCLRADNLRNGRAFEFVVRSGGTEGGVIELGGSAPNALRSRSRPTPRAGSRISTPTSSTDSRRPISGPRGQW